MTTSRIERTDDTTGWATRANVVFWALLFGLAVMVGADPALRESAAGGSDDSPFASADTLLTVLRVSTFAFALLLALLQAWVYGLLFGAVTGAPRPRLRTGWGHVLMSQVPFVLLVGGAFAVDGTAGAASVLGLGVRLALGVLAVAIYAVLASRPHEVALSRVVVFVVLGSAVNSALLLLSGQA